MKIVVRLNRHYGIERILPLALRIYYKVEYFICPPLAGAWCIYAINQFGNFG